MHVSSDDKEKAEGYLKKLKGGKVSVEVMKEVGDFIKEHDRAEYRRMEEEAPDIFKSSSDLNPGEPGYSIWFSRELKTRLGQS